MTIPTGFVKSTIQAPSAAHARHALRDAEDDRNRPQRLAESAGAGRLLADAPARQRHGLVGEARILPADPDLDEDEVRPVDRAIEMVSRRQPAREALSLEHSRGQSADDLAPLRIDVVEHELTDVDALALT